MLRTKNGSRDTTSIEMKGKNVVFLLRYPNLQCVKHSEILLEILSNNPLQYLNEGT